MLKLKRVEVQGFKSFFDRTEMKFSGTGMAAIVGPNGCGKSNLSDAISWVLGEQSAKTLRGARMEDVIFAGTRDRKPMGMASVTMTLVPAADPPRSETGARLPDAAGATDAQHANGHSSGGPLPTEATKTAERAGEITITRRLYRSGESEYLINGKLARLRDIQDLFLGTGLGPESYAIIEQGRIGQILSNRPQDRRSVIEEAAGITKFKARKRLAEGKLESAKQNLSRVFDILEEVTRQVNSLKRQAAKTKRYAELKAEARTHLRQVLAAKFRMLERDAAKQAIELNLASAELQSVQRAILESEERQAACTEAAYGNEQQLTAARKTVADLRLEAERARGRLTFQIREIQQIELRLAAGGQESKTLEQKRHASAAELERQTLELTELEQERASLHGQLEAKSAEREQAQKKLSAEEKALEGARQTMLELLGQSSTLKNRITHGEAQVESTERETARARLEEQQSESELRTLETLAGEVATRLAERQAQLTAVSEQRLGVQEELQQKRTQLNESSQAFERLRVELSRIKARKDSLAEILEHRSYTTETVKRFFTAVEQAQNRDLEPLGVLADFMEVDPQFEKAAEEFLHDELEYVVVRNWAEAERGIEVMRTDLNGRATFLVEEAGRLTELNADVRRPPLESGMTRLTDAVRLTNGFAHTPVKLLPRIADCYVVEDRVVAQQRATEYPQCWFLASDGVSYHGQVVSGGKKNGAGPLALKRELREVSAMEQVKQQAVEAAETKLAHLERAISRLSEELEHLRTEQQAQEKEVLALDHESRKVAEEIQRTGARLSRARTELDQLSKNRVQLQRSLEQDRETLTALELRSAEQDQALAAAREQLNICQTEVARVTEEHATLRASAASMEERHRSLAANRARLASQLEEFIKRRQEIELETERLIAERTEFLGSNEELEAKSAELNSTISGAEESVGQLAEQETELRDRLVAIDEELKLARAQAQTVQDSRSELQVKLARAESDLQHLDETCRRELAMSMSEALVGLETVPDGDALADIESEYGEVRRKIDALGPVNPQALEEFEEAQQRQEFLNAQRQDLLDSIRDTEKAIEHIDRESQKRFTEAFHAINANFRETFSNLFGGGVGEMRLTEEDNVAESGIDIVASPPGKKLQSVLLLSGGEKSLTAMGLLMAIFQYTPSPFCVLDEIDAPLDEPNIERLNKLLKEMSQHTQFIVITHAKRTMEAAQTLYGVTMQEPGVSKLVSVKFDRSGEKRQSGDQARSADQESLEPAASR